MRIRKRIQRKCVIYKISPSARERDVGKTLATTYLKNLETARHQGKGEGERPYSGSEDAPEGTRDIWKLQKITELLSAKSVQIATMIVIIKEKRLLQK